MAYKPRLKEFYQQDVSKKFMEKYGFKTVSAVPTLQKIVLNIGLGEGSKEPKLLEVAADELTLIAGQRAVISRAKKSIANIKIRAGMPVGCRVTLRGNRMWEFLDRFVSVALPRVRDFRGIPATGFDGRGNYTLGLEDHLIFLELDYTKVDKPKGMNVTICTSAGNDEKGYFLLASLGMPFAK
jgi:large subunit ribosomal protein L5